jgi:DNA (cytosine-5)-methyltransferase 1
MITAADLFCGAGGTSQGLVEAALESGRKLELTAVNHWPVAVATHSENHPDARHLCASLDSVNPRSLFNEDALDLLWASPECTHHSIARGGKPMNDQSRATAWCVVRWAEALRPKVILIENVKEFLSWGPIGTNGQPITKRKGELFRAWVAALEACGYRVEWRTLCAADYGDPTTRRRLFIYAVRGRRKIVWPEPTHAPKESVDMFSHARKPWVPAREIIDWNLKGNSIYKRKRPLAEKTMRRILIGLERFGLAPFIVPQQQGGKPVHAVENPLNTITTTSRGIGVAEPFLIKLQGTSTAAGVDQPAPTITAGGGHLGLVQPYLVQTNHGNGDAEGDNRRSKPVTEPLPTVAGNRGEWAVCEPFIVGIDHHGGNGNAVRPIDAPISAVTTKQRHAVCQPFIVGVGGPERAVEPQPTSKPLNTVLCRNNSALIEPYLIKFYGTDDGQPVSEPLATVTTKDRFGLCQPQIEVNGEKYLVDILFRMLKPEELARAQGFPRGYKFTGNTSEVVKQIGNAVPKNLAKALAKSAMEVL